MIYYEAKKNIRSPLLLALAIAGFFFTTAVKLYSNEVGNTTIAILMAFGAFFFIIRIMEWIVNKKPALAADNYGIHVDAIFARKKYKWDNIIRFSVRHGYKAPRYIAVTLNKDAEELGWWSKATPVPRHDEGITITLMSRILTRLDVERISDDLNKSALKNTHCIEKT